MKRFLVELKRSKHAAARLLCFPYAGGHAAYAQSWAAKLPARVELFGVSYRPNFTVEPVIRSVQSIASAVLEEVLDYTDRPLLLFGYSLGAFVAYELSLLLARRTPHLPTELIVAACRAPHIARDRLPMAGLADTEFIARLRDLGGTPQAVIDDPELLSFFMPILRADIATAETYQPTTAAPLPCPITAIAGNADASTDPSTVAAWELRTRNRFRLHCVEGHHFFLQQQPQAVLAIVREVLARQVPGL
jgi:medium-chain acyl-[acyl-carrier-protein] hydrolase